MYIYIYMHRARRRDDLQGLHHVFVLRVDCFIMFGLFVVSLLSVYVYIYIYIYRERERDVYICLLVS